MLTTEFIPAREPGSRWLLVMLHGLGDSLAGFRFLPTALRLPWLNYLLVNAPDDYYGGYSWYDIPGNAGPGVARSRKLVAELLDAQRAAGFPTEQTYLGGFSQGCLMTIDAGASYPHRFAGLLGVSGYVFEPERLLREMPPVAREQRFLITHGHFDPLIPLAGVKGQIEQLRAGGLNLAWHEFAKEHTIAGEPEFAVLRDFITAGRKD